MQPIGFMNSVQRREQEAVEEAEPMQISSPQEQAMLQAIAILRNYFDPYYGPMLNKEEYHFSKLRKLKERYFDPI